MTTTTSTVSTTLREEAAERFRQLGWPTTRVEEWRYTNLAPVQKVAWRVDDEPTLIQTPSPLAGQAVLELTFVNGRMTGSPAEWPAGVKPLVVAEETIADWQRKPMVALNLAHSQEGARIEVAPGAVVEGFIHLLFFGRGDGIWSHPRNVIHVGANAQVTIVETYLGTGSYFTNTLTEIVAGEGAVVDHYKLQNESDAAYHVGSLFVRQARSSSVITRSVAVGSLLARTETAVALDGEGASATLDGLFVGTGSQHLDNVTAVDHVQPRCESAQLYKGILDQNARGVFDGLIIVRPGAEKTASRQENRNLLLSGTAIVDSKPNLEIHNDDVKCSHGSTIGQIDADTLFYLRSRGIDEQEARSLLVYAFASEIVDRMKIEVVREQVRRALFRVLPERLPEQRGEPR